MREVGAASCWGGVWLIPVRSAEHLASKPAGYPVPRGTMVVRSKNSALSGSRATRLGCPTRGTTIRERRASRAASARSACGEGALELIAHEALALTKMDWNNDGAVRPGAGEHPLLAEAGSHHRQRCRPAWQRLPVPTLHVVPEPPSTTRALPLHENRCNVLTVFTLLDPVHVLPHVAGSGRPHHSHRPNEAQMINAIKCLAMLQL